MKTEHPTSGIVPVVPRKRKQRWQPHKLTPGKPDHIVWRRLDRVRQMGVCWGAAFDDFIAAAVCLREIGELDYVLELWPRVRSRKLRCFGAEVVQAGRWMQQHPLATPTCQRIWPQLFPEKSAPSAKSAVETPPHIL